MSSPGLRLSLLAALLLAPVWSGPGPGRPPPPRRTADALCRLQAAQRCLRNGPDPRHDPRASLPRGLVCSDFPYTYWFPFFCQFAPSRCVGHFYYAKRVLCAQGPLSSLPSRRHRRIVPRALDPSLTPPTPPHVMAQGLRYPSPSLSPSWAKGLSISIKELLQSSLSLEGPDLSRPNGISPGPLDKAPPGPKAQAKAPALPRPSPEAGAKAPSGPGPGAQAWAGGQALPSSGAGGQAPALHATPGVIDSVRQLIGSEQDLEPHPHNHSRSPNHTHGHHHGHGHRHGGGGAGGGGGGGGEDIGEDIGEDVGEDSPVSGSLQTLPHDAALLVLCFALLRDSCTRSPAAWAWQRIENETLGFGDTVCDSHGRRHLSSCPLCAFCSLKLEQCQEESTLKREFCGPSHQTPFSSPFLAAQNQNIKMGPVTKGLYYGLEVFGGLRMAFWCGRLAVQGCEETRVSGWLQAEFLSFQRGDFPTKICDSNKVEYPNYCAFKSRQCLLYSRDSQKVFRQSCQRNESYSQLSEASAEEAVLSWSREFGRLTQG
ncbi:acrosin-binding protein [Ornithorhynchus anatinus]|uniref:acrosin-binding protein n=1 Tax=Ornithorhynchus anatinus TaxID=9258 RepID=UPI0010A8A139|nr:acrosin-binding protein [Ornithorhynchus anatinus]